MIDDFQVKTVQTVIWVRMGRGGYAENEPQVSQNEVLGIFKKKPIEIGQYFIDFSL